MVKMHCKNWDTRNNSANVAASVNPKMHCYCNQKKIPPRLFPRPKDCIFDYDDTRRTRKLSPLGPGGVVWCPKFRQVGIDSEEESGGWGSPRKMLGDGGDWRRERYELGGDSSEEEEDADSLGSGYMDWGPSRDGKNGFGRSEPSRTRRREEEDPSRTRRKYEDPSRTRRKREEDPEFGRTGEEESPGPAPDRTKKTSPEAGREPSLKQLTDFRNDHYFETHSTEDLFKTVPEHICVHRFGLDDRLLPQALNPDPYEASRCIICGKPMTTSPVAKVDDREIPKKQKNVFPKFYKYGLAPKKIYLANGKDLKIEMCLDLEDAKWKLKPGEKPNYFNTYALRYQKGVA